MLLRMLATLMLVGVIVAATAEVQPPITSKVGIVANNPEPTTAVTADSISKEVLQDTHLENIVGVNLRPLEPLNLQSSFRYNPLTDNFELSTFSVPSVEKESSDTSKSAKANSQQRLASFNPWLRQYLSYQTKTSDYKPFDSSPLYSFKSKSRPLPKFTKTDDEPVPLDLSKFLVQKKTGTVKPIPKEEQLPVKSVEKPKEDAPPKTNVTELVQKRDVAEVATQSPRKDVITTPRQFVAPIVSVQPLKVPEPEKPQVTPEIKKVAQQPASLQKQVQFDPLKLSVAVVPVIKTKAILQAPVPVNASTVKAEDGKSETKVISTPNKTEPLKEKPLNTVDVSAEKKVDKAAGVVSSSNPPRKPSNQRLRLTLFSKPNIVWVVIKQPRFPHCNEVYYNHCIECESGWKLASGHCTKSS